MSTKKPLLTISLLISNRPDTIPRCLDSLGLIMEEIPSEGYSQTHDMVNSQTVER